MILQDVIKRCDFKNIAPIIKEHYPKEAVNMYKFKEAFDCLRHMEPKRNPESSFQQIEIGLFYDEYEKKDYIHAMSCEGDFWESNLAKEIVVSEKLTLSDDEIVARCLWHMTFFGSQQSDIDTEEERDHHRQEFRTKKLERLARFENTIRRLQRNSTKSNGKQYNHLFDSKLMYSEKYRTYAYDVKKRVDYLIDLFTNYEPDDFSKLNHFDLVVRSSSKHPLKEREWWKLNKYFSKRLGQHCILDEARDDSLNTEICLVFVGIQIDEETLSKRMFEENMRRMNIYFLEAMECDEIIDVTPNIT